LHLPLPYVTKFDLVPSWARRARTAQDLFLEQISFLSRTPYFSSSLAFSFFWIWSVSFFPLSQYCGLLSHMGLTGLPRGAFFAVHIYSFFVCTLGLFCLVHWAFFWATEILSVWFPLLSGSSFPPTHPLILAPRFPRASSPT
jgi:hypothetical protein